MKKHILIFIHLLFTCNLNAQYEEDEKRVASKSPLFSEKTINKEFDTLQKLKLTEIEFEKELTSFIFDSSKNIIIGIENIPGIFSKSSIEDKLFALDMSENKLLWDRIYRNDDYFISYNHLFVREEKKMHCLDIRNLNKKWELTGKFYGVSEKFNVAITYNKNFWGIKNGLFGFDLDSGNLKWSNESIVLTHGFNYKSFFKDTQMIFLNDKLYGLNVLTGKSWEIIYPFINGCSAGNYHGQCPYCSNFYIDSLGFYIANDKTLANYNFNGEEKWKTSLPVEEEKRSGKSNLFKRYNHFFVINKGYTVLGNYKAFVPGKPFIAKYSKDGTLVNKYIFNSQDIVNYKLEINGFFVVQKRGITILDSNLNLISYKKISRDEVSEWDDFVESDFLIKELDSFKKIHIDSNQLIYMILNDYSMNIYDTSMTLKNKINESNYYYEFKIKNDSSFKIIVNFKNKIFIFLNSKNKPVYSISDLSDIQLSNDKVYLASKNKIYIIKRKEFE